MNRSQTFLEESSVKLSELSSAMSDAFSKAAELSDLARLPTQSFNSFQRAIGYSKDVSVCKIPHPELANSFDIILNRIKEIQNDPNYDKDPNLKLQAVLCYIAICDYTTAFILMGNIHETLEGFISPYHPLVIGSLYQYFDYHDKSVWYYTNCLSQNLGVDNTFELLFRLGISYRSLGYHNESISCFKQLYDFLPSYLQQYDVDLQVATSFLAAGQYTQASNMFNQLYTKFPENENVIQSYLWCLYLESKQQQNFKKALSFISVMPQKFKAIPTVNLICGRVFMAIDDNRTAYDNLTQCITEMTISPYYWCMLGSIYSKNEQIDDSIMAYQRALHLDIRCTEAWFNLVLNVLRQGNGKHAELIVANARNECPEVIPALESLIKMKQATIMDIDDSKLFILPAEAIAKSLTDSIPQLSPVDLGLPENTQIFAQTRRIASAF